MDLIRSERGVYHSMYRSHFTMRNWRRRGRSVSAINLNDLAHTLFFAIFATILFQSFSYLPSHLYC